MTNQQNQIFRVFPLRCVLLLLQKHAGANDHTTVRIYKREKESVP